MTQPEPEGAAEDISNEELAALGLASQEPAAPAAALDDAISPDELLALGITPSPPRAAPPPAPPMPSAPPPKAAAAPAAGFAPLAAAVAEATVENGMSLLYDVPLRVSVELGRISMTLQQVLGLGRGAIVELDRLAGEPVDILVNDTIIGRGEVVVVDEYFGVKITELIEAKG